MKKFFAFFCVLILFAGFAVANDIGLAVGAEFGVGNVTKANDDDMAPYAMPFVTYDKSFFDDALDFSTELDYTFDLEPKFDGISDQLLDFNLSLTYNLGLGSASTLSLGVDHDAHVTISPAKPDGTNFFGGILTPAVKFNQELDFGDVYVKFAAPIGYIDELDKNAKTTVDLESRLGWDSTFGLGLWIQAYSSLVPSSNRELFQGLGATVSYETDSFYFEVFARTYKELSSGIEITPEFDYYFGNFTFYANCEFTGIAADSGDVTISPALGIKFSF